MKGRERRSLVRMKRAIAIEYLKTIIFAVLATVVMSTLVCYLAFFYNQTVDDNMPQYFIQNVKPYIQISGKDDISLDGEGEERLDIYQLWLQVLDEKGNVVYEKNVPEDVPMHYSNFELVNYVLHSNQLGQYTIYAAELSEDLEYGILIGCDSSFVTKYSYSFSGNGQSIFWKCLFVFLVITVLVIAVVSYRFSRKVTTPISRALGNIKDIQKGREIQVFPASGEKLFSDVFVSIQKLQSALKENEKLRAEWITNISHDIKTPLSVIKGYAELLSSDDYNFDKQEQILYAKQILQSEENMKSLVEDLKISQMLVEGEYKLNLQKISLTELIKECIQKTNLYIKQEPAINFTYEREVEILADKKLLERCFVNIICNAYIHNINKEDICVDISLSGIAGGICIIIADNGRGMKAEDMEHIFERYYRGTASGKVKGTGLGLAIAKEAVVAHGGEIQVTSIWGEGTKFVITI